MRTTALALLLSLGINNASIASGLAGDIGSVIMPSRPQIFSATTKQVVPTPAPAAQVVKTKEVVKKVPDNNLDKVITSIKEEYASLKKDYEAKLAGAQKLKQEKEAIYTAGMAVPVNVDYGQPEDVNYQRGKVTSEVIQAPKKINGKEVTANPSFFASFKDYTKEPTKQQYDIQSPRQDKDLANIAPASGKAKSVNGYYEEKENPFSKAFSSLRPEKNEKEEEKRTFTSKRRRISKEDSREFKNAYLSSEDVKKDLYNAYITENKYLNPAGIFNEDEMDRDSSNRNSASFEQDVLQIKIQFEDDSAAINNNNLTILRNFSHVAQSDPTKGVQITISDEVLRDIRKKKLVAKRLALVSKVLQEAGLSEDQIVPVITDRSLNSFAFSIVSVDEFENYKASTRKDMFGEEIDSKAYRTMRW